ncbi:MAG: family 1 glycosylhydrolase, partial [Deltaproteobacteria bacterium]|nr:family 1 glycosylhydrolase [Deltaproteobacteria bacterium]
RAGDLALIKQPIDFLGVNYYRTSMVRYSLRSPMLKAEAESISAPGWGRTTLVGNGINPPGLTAVLLNIKENYGNPKVYITENGVALEDTPDRQDFVADWGRINFLRDHLRAALDAIQAGVNLKGYYVWSLMDNFEWSVGYIPRFGIVRVDFKTQKRTLKQSAHWYREVMASNSIND